MQSPWQVRATTAERVALAGISATDPDTARSGLPPLLRSYLAMGGRVGQEAVIDRDLDREHVWRSYDYPHVVMLYYHMYEIAKLYPEMSTYLDAAGYLERARK